MPNSSHIESVEPRVSRRLGALFPPGVVAVEMSATGDPARLMPEEAVAVARAVPRRVAEFAAGRSCARHALAEFDCGGWPIRAAADRQPIWPAGMVGSITHTAGLCAAAVARTDRVAAIGLDCERVADVSADLWDTLCTPREAKWLSSLPEGSRPAVAALLFSAKEAFYKCQYPLTGEWLDFHDLDITPDGGGRSSGGFGVLARRPLKLESTQPGPWQGRYLFHEEFVSTGIGLARSSGGG